MVALIAYERPEASPLAHLLAPTQREAVADAVNAAVLCVAASLPPPTPSTQPTTMSQALPVQLVCTTATNNGNNSGGGDPCTVLSSAGARPPPQCPLELLLKQLAACRAAAREEAGDVGEVFSLAAVLLPPPAG